MDWRCGSSGEAPALLVQSPERKKKKKKKREKRNTHSKVIYWSVNKKV
jgi:hypothetical protein